jgi:hypothetical protein
MIRQVMLLIVLAAFSVVSVYSQGHTSERARELAAGQQVRLSDTLAVKVTRATTNPFTGVKVKGEPVVVVLGLDAGKKNVTLFYKPTPELSTSELYLTVGNQKLVPRAVIEDFPSLGTDNDKEIEVLDPKEGTGGGTVEFEGQGSISLLFDVPASQSKAPKKLSGKLRVLKPTNEEHSFVAQL